MQDKAVILSGGSWAVDLNNILDINPQKVAEATSNVDWNSSQFKVDLGYQRNYIGLLFFANLRTTSSGLMRVRVSLNSDMSAPSYDTGFVTTWPQDSVAGEFTAWGEWTLNGVYSSEEYEKLGFTRFFIPSSPVQGKYILVEIHNQTASSPVQIGCFGACEVWESPIDFAPAPQITILDESDVSRVPFGSSYITLRPTRLRFNFGFPALENDEVLSKTLGLALIKGKSQPLVAVSYPDQNESLEKTSVYGLITADGVLSNPFFGHYQQPIQIDSLA